MLPLSLDRRWRSAVHASHVLGCSGVVPDELTLAQQVGDALVFHATLGLLHQLLQVMDLTTKTADVPHAMEHAGQPVVLVLQALVEHLRSSLFAYVLQPSDCVDAVGHSMRCFTVGILATASFRTFFSFIFPL